jgi:hypothetical protein
MKIIFHPPCVKGVAATNFKPIKLHASLPNGCLQQIAANGFSISQDAIASLLQCLVLAALVLLPLSLGVWVKAEQLFCRPKHPAAELPSRCRAADIRNGLPAARGWTALRQQRDQIPSSISTSS